MNKPRQPATVLAFVTLLTGLVMLPASAFSQRLTSAELVLLPDYCSARMEGHNSAAYQSWSQRFGESNFLHIHHYCFGLNQLNRAKMEFEPHKQTSALNRAIREFDYVLKHFPVDL